jgi:hypothetical protein
MEWELSTASDNEIKLCDCIDMMNLVQKSRALVENTSFSSAGNRDLDGTERMVSKLRMSGTMLDSQQVSSV